MSAEVWNLEGRADRALTLTAGSTVVRYTGRYAEAFPSPMVFAGSCACAARCRIPGQPERHDRLTLADYPGGPVELSHVDPDHVRPVRQSEYRYILGEE